MANTYTQIYMHIRYVQNGKRIIDARASTKNTSSC
jgi:hypothetical protein